MLEGWRIEQICDSARFQVLEPGIAQLLALYRDVLLDASCGDDLAVLVENLSGSLPLLWVLLGPADRKTGEPFVCGLATLTDVVPRRHAFLHGISHPCIRRHPLIQQTALAAITYAFRQFEALKVKAEFEADNRGAKGFCLRMGFRKEAHFKRDNRVQGALKDVLLYSLPYERARVLHALAF